MLDQDTSDRDRSIIAQQIVIVAAQLTEADKKIAHLGRQLDEATALNKALTSHNRMLQLEITQHQTTINANKLVITNLKETAQTTGQQDQDTIRTLQMALGAANAKIRVLEKEPLVALQQWRSSRITELEATVAQLTAQISENDREWAEHRCD